MRKSGNVHAGRYDPCAGEPADPTDPTWCMLVESAQRDNLPIPRELMERAVGEAIQHWLCQMLIRTRGGRV
jgi:hypothetical protein